MLEFLTFIFSCLAIIWSRKNDLQQQLSDQRSRIELARHLRSPDIRFTKYLGTLADYVMRIIGNGGLETFFVCLFLALLYTCISFLLTVAISNGNSVFLQASTEYPHFHRILFLVIIGLTIATYLCGRIGVRVIDVHRVPPHRIESDVRRGPMQLGKRQRGFHLFGVSTLMFANAVVYESIALFLITAVIAGGSAFLSRSFLPNQVLIKQPIPVAAGACLGAFGAGDVIAYSLARDAGSGVAIALTGVSLLSGLIAYLGVHASKLKDELNVRPRDGSLRSAIFSSIGRPPMFAGFHCIRAVGSYSLSGAFAIIACWVLEDLATVSGIILSVSAILLAAAMVLAASTTLAGAGAISFSGVLLLLVYVLSVQPPLMFTRWAYFLVFFAILPTISGIFDYVRWSLLLQSIKLRLARSRFVFGSVGYLMADIALTCTAIVVFTIFAPAVIRLFDAWAISEGFDAPINVDRYIDSARADFGDNGFWIVVTISSMLLPTLLNILLLFWSGILSLVPQSLRNQLAAEVEATKSSRRQMDSLAWRVATVDSLAGTIFFLTSLCVVIYAMIWVSPSVGEALYFFATQLR